MLLFNDEEHAMPTVSWAREPIERWRMVCQAEKKNLPMAAKTSDTINRHAPKIVLYHEFAKVYLAAQALNFQNLTLHSRR